MTASSGAALELSLHKSSDEAEERDRLRLLELAQIEQDPWSRALPLHLTASALVVHVPSSRVLLRWHDRLNQWMQVGGHGDAGEVDPLQIATREAEEETGLSDLRLIRPPLHERSLLQVVVVGVPAQGDELAHEHGDLRYLLATDHPDLVRPESPSAGIRWLTLEQALEELTCPNLRELLRRSQKVLVNMGSCRPSF